MVALLEDVLQRVGDGSGARGDGQSRHAPFESRYTILKHSLRGVGQTSVDVPCIAETEAVGSMLRVVEDVRRRLIDGYGPCVGCRVGTLLAHMQGQRLNMKIFLFHFFTLL